MKRKRLYGLTFGVAFVLLLVDGVAAVWLGQITGRRSLLVVGLLLIAASLAVALMYGRWRRALEEIEAARRDLVEEIGALRRAVEDARAGGPRNN